LCGAPLSQDEVITWRPFSCPKCQKFIDPTRPYSLSIAGCLSVLAVCSAILILSGLGWFLGLGLGIAISILIGAVGSKLLQRYWPRPPVLRRYWFRTEPQNLLRLADLLEAIAASEQWNEHLDWQLMVVSQQRSLDDWLENSACESAEAFKRALQGLPESKKVATNRNLTMDERREQLHALARDLRIGAS
jgi:hypothetical protein